MKFNNEINRIPKGQQGLSVKNPNVSYEARAKLNMRLGRSPDGRPLEKGLVNVYPEMALIGGVTGLGKRILSSVANLVTSQPVNNTLNLTKTQSIAEKISRPAEWLNGQVLKGVKTFGNDLEKASPIIGKPFKFVVNQMYNNPDMVPGIIGGSIKKGQNGMKLPSNHLSPAQDTSYVNTPAFADIDDIKLNQTTLPWSDALNKVLNKQKTTNEMFDPDLIEIQQYKDKIPTYAKTLSDSGYSKEQVAGILGSIFQESKFRSDKHQQGGGKGFGLAQWTTGDVRFKQLASLAKKLGKPITDEGVQMQHLVTELNAPSREHILNAWGGRGRREQFMKTNQVDTATQAFTNLFLRAGKADMPRRLKYSNYIYDIIK